MMTTTCALANGLLTVFGSDDASSMAVVALLTARPAVELVSLQISSAAVVARRSLDLLLLQRRQQNPSPCCAIVRAAAVSEKMLLVALDAELFAVDCRRCSCTDLSHARVVCLNTAAARFVVAAVAVAAVAEQPNAWVAAVGGVCGAVLFDICCSSSEHDVAMMARRKNVHLLAGCAVCALAFEAESRILLAATTAGRIAVFDLHRGGGGGGGEELLCTVDAALERPVSASVRWAAKGPQPQLVVLLTSWHGTQVALQRRLRRGSAVWTRVEPLCCDAVAGTHENSGVLALSALLCHEGRLWVLRTDASGTALELVRLDSGCVHKSMRSSASSSSAVRGLAVVDDGKAALWVTEDGELYSSCNLF